MLEILGVRFVGEKDRYASKTNKQTNKTSLSQAEYGKDQQKKNASSSCQQNSSLP